MITVTKSFLPPLNAYLDQVKRIYQSGQLTNRGKLTLELEENLKSRFHLSHLLITNNGTVPIQLALNLWGDKGEIITTPFSYVATTSSIVWESCIPIFVDIDPVFLTIDETKIENAITNKTTAILATHVFGNPCNIEVIDAIAKKHDLKVIYDAAHCFDVSYKDKSVFAYGDASTCSFHATKIFHTGEGGAIFCNDADTLDKLFYRHNFGHHGPHDFVGVGINGKISELQAAMGLAVLPLMESIHDSRAVVVGNYNQGLKLNKLQNLTIRPGTKWNNSYYPVVFENEKVVGDILNRLNAVDIFPRRYFYPSLNTICYVGKTLAPVSESISTRVICLPLYSELNIIDQERIIDLINKII